jgi:hypothetical protein
MEAVDTKYKVDCKEYFIIKIGGASITDKVQTF